MEMNEVVNGQELVNKAYDAMETAAKELDSKITETGLQPVANALTTAPASQPGKNYTVMNLAVGTGLVVGGGLLGFAVDHWGVPKVKAAWANHKVKKAEKKAAKEAKKNGKKGQVKKAETKTDPEPVENKQEPTDGNNGIDPTTIDTKIE